MKIRWLIFPAVLMVLFIANTAAAAANNLMGRQSSPYLQLHASDLVHWRPWGQAALSEAKKTGKPIFLSIGYLSCHWCHVMRRESFTDPVTANLINDKFIAILIDREEMPNVDSNFQSAAVVLGLPGGWPLNMFLTSDAQPFWGGTYFPKKEMAGMPTFAFVLDQISTIYNADPKAAGAHAARVTQTLNRVSRVRPGSLTMDEIDAAATAFRAQVNPFYGGFGDAPLFPLTVAQELLWRAFIRTGDADYKDAVTTTLEAMIRGGVYDHVGGGFFRYAVDPQWNVPHFEKMLDINAAMIALISEVWRETRDDQLKKRVYQTIAFLLREMRLQGGAFASALDADSRISTTTEQEEEGAYYVWDKATLKTVLGEEAAPFLRAFDLSPPETGVEGDPGILHRTDASVDDKVTAAALKILLQARQKRPRPRIDAKVLADWNAMTIIALVKAGRAFGEPNWVLAAQRAFAFIDENLNDDAGRLHHSWTAGSLGVPAGLDDLAAMADTAIVLYEATGETPYLDKARQWSEAAIDGLWDEAEAGFYAAPASAIPDFIRAKPIYDQTAASGNARMIDVLARLYYLGGEEKYLTLAQTGLKAFAGFAEGQPLGVSGLINAAETLRAALQIVIIGGRGEAATDALLAQVAGLSLPARTLQVIAAGTVLPEGHPARYKEQVEGLATAYVCRGNFCSLPATSRESLAETLIAMRRR